MSKLGKGQLTTVSGIGIVSRSSRAALSEATCTGLKATNLIDLENPLAYSTT
jgi:hypothetical protein